MLEYAERCRQIGVAVDAIEVPEGDIAIAIERSEKVPADVETWKPPEELEDYHALATKALRVMITWMKDSGYIGYYRELERLSELGDREAMEKLSAEMEDALWDFTVQTQEFDSETARIDEALPSDIRELLIEAGCL